MSLLAPTPTRLRPFVPLVSSHNRQKSLSPPPDLSSGVNSTLLPGSSGMFLLIRNVLPSNRTGFGTPVELVREALAETLLAEHGNDLIDVGVSVLPGGRPQDTHSSSAYLELSYQTKSLDPLPRPDLLSEWMTALSITRPNWDIVWAPAKKGKDRRMNVRFRVAETKEKVPFTAADKIRAHLESKGHRTTGGYISFNGLVDVTLADTHSVDTILASTYFVIPSIAKDGLQVSPSKYLPVNNAFEMCIGGINEYEGLHEIIEKWLYHKYVHDDPARSTRVFDTRISPDREYFIFTMDSWESTLIVLKDIEAFRSYFVNSPLLSDPKLIFEMNSSGFARKSTVATINNGAGLVNEAITDLKRDLATFHKEQTENNSLVQRQVSAIHVSMENQANTVARIGDQLQQFGLSLLAGRDEKAIECRIGQIDGSLAFETQCLRSSDDPAEKIELKANIVSLKNERREQIALLAKASANTIRLIGPPPGTLISLPSQLPPIMITPEQAPEQSHCSPPSSQLPSASQPQPNSSVTTVNLPSTPTRQPTVPALQPSSSLSSTTFNSACNIFDFSSLNTPTPTSFPRNSATTKRGQPTDAPESPTKRLRSSERITNSRANPKATSATSSADEDSIMDLFNDSGKTVRSLFMTKTSSLITAYADKGEHRSRSSGLRPLTYDEPPVITKQLGMPSATDQMGRVHNAEHLFSKPMCHNTSRKFIPNFILWIIVTLIVLSTASAAAAAATPAGSLSLYAINTNGFVHPTKIDATNRAISHRNPDVVVITETKTNASCSTKMAYTEYQFFEERGIPVTGHHLYKWGLILGIKKGISVSQRLPITHPALKARMIAVDIVIPLESGLGFTHRIIAAYAP